MTSKHMAHSMPEAMGSSPEVLGSLVWSPMMHDMARHMAIVRLGVIVPTVSGAIVGGAYSNICSWNSWHLSIYLLLLIYFTFVFIFSTLLFLTFLLFLYPPISIQISNTCFTFHFCILFV